MQRFLWMFQSPGKTGKRLVGLICLFVCAGVCIVCGVAYKVYEDQVTSGIGFFYADEIALAPEAPVLEKKKRFFDFMRPVAVVENARIQRVRQKIVAARDHDENPGWLGDVAESYGVEWTGTEWTQLLMRVDTVPLTLVLAQSANESSWGQSKFAQTGNNMFGQWCFSKGCGMVPARRNAGERHEVAVYYSVNGSVRAYLHNINRTRAYASLRAMRWKARQKGNLVTGESLARGLLSYSARGREYVEEIREMIEADKALMLGTDKTLLPGAGL